jgi:hypothetical protein
MAGAALELELPLPQEPAELLAETRALVERSSAEGAALIDQGEWIVEPLWRDWGTELEQAGMRREELVQVAIDYRMELWLWVMRERTWPHCSSGLRGRVLRRLAAGL